MERACENGPIVVLGKEHGLREGFMQVDGALSWRGLNEANKDFVSEDQWSIDMERAWKEIEVRQH